MAFSFARPPTNKSVSFTTAVEPTLAPVLLRESARKIMLLECILQGDLFRKQQLPMTTTTTLLSSIVVQWFLSVSLSILILIGVPLSFYNTIHPAKNEHYFFEVSRFATQVLLGWTSLLHVSAWLLLVIISFVGLLLAQKCHNSSSVPCNINGNAACALRTTGLLCCRGYIGIGSMEQLWKRKHTPTRPFSAVALATFGLGFAFALSIAVQSNLQMIRPSWAWNPFLWGGYYRVYKPDTMRQAMHGLCVNDNDKQPPALDVNVDVDVRLPISSPGTKLAKNMFRPGTSGDQSQSQATSTSPLCLNESQWRELSTEALSSQRQDDVDAVLRGLKYAQHESGGMIISVMSRDTIDAIVPLRQNVEGLLPFFGSDHKISVVVFENDSRDGSRQAFYQWANDVEVVGQYKVDVIECDEVPECRFHEHHRDFVSTDDSDGAKTPYAKTSAIGRMAEFRNRMVTHILKDPSYTDFTHMLVLDVDLGVSLSPLGVLHTLGTLPNDVVASSGRQVWPGSFGTITPPYDFSAFQAHETPQNKRLLALHKQFCHLKPKGDRWRNECHAVSPMQMMMVLGEDHRLGSGLLSDISKPYMVDSAFNGATLYPIGLVRSTKAQYDVGDDGQRCEHIGFNLSLNQTMYVNPQWNMHVSPNAPGGPTGRRASQSIQGIASSPMIGPIIFLQHMVCMILFVYAVLTLSIKVVYPFWVKLLTMVSGISLFADAAMVSHVAGRRANTQRRDDGDVVPAPAISTASTCADLESLLNPEIHVVMSPRKRKVSDFDAP
jgi:hypothetical protein